MVETKIRFTREKPRRKIKRLFGDKIASIRTVGNQLEINFKSPPTMEETKKIQWIWSRETGVTAR